MLIIFGHRPFSTALFARCFQVLASAGTIDNELASQFQLQTLAKAVSRSAYTVADAVRNATISLLSLAGYTAVRPLWLQLKAVLCCEVSSMYAIACQCVGRSPA
jgi:hypothetical protein